MAPAPPPGYPPPPGYYPPPGTPTENTPYPSALYQSTPTTPDVAAQPAPSAPRSPARFTFGATLGTTVESEPGSTSVVFSPLLEGAYEMFPAVLLDLAWGFGWLVDNEGIGESTARAGNPTLSGFYRITSMRGTSEQDWASRLHSLISPSRWTGDWMPSCSIKPWP